MGSSQDERYAFTVEWYDQQAELIRRYELFYYPKDCSVEMFDVKNKRMFLRRTKITTFTMKDLYIGSVIPVYSRQLTIVDYGDNFTRQKLGSQKERSFCIIKPHAMHKLGPILDLVVNNGFIITKLRKMKITEKDGKELYREFQNHHDFYALLDSLISTPVVALEVIGDLAVSKFKQLAGPADSSIAKTESPLSLRARFGGTNKFEDVVYVSEDHNRVGKDLELFFPSNGEKKPNLSLIQDSTLCVVKPHAVQAGFLGKIIEAISECNFEIVALVLMTIEKANAEEFFEVYKGVLPEYSDMVIDLMSGPCVVMELRAQDAPTVFRELCGPYDPEIARHLRPRTLRARFGKSKVQNAVHCTDLPEDAPLELEYFFKILDR